MEDPSDLPRGCRGIINDQIFGFMCKLLGLNQSEKENLRRRVQMAVLDARIRFSSQVQQGVEESQPTVNRVTAWKTIFKIIIIETCGQNKHAAERKMDNGVSNSRRSSSILKTTGVNRSSNCHQFFWSSIAKSLD
jgi:hypothetical protein